MTQNARSRVHAAVRGMPAALALALAVACSGAARDAAPPDTAPSFVGHIAAKNAAKDATTILVVAAATQPAGADRASVRLPAEARVLRADGTRGKVDDLHVGQAVRLWFHGPVAESYPVQATAGLVVIDKEATP